MKFDEIMRNIRQKAYAESLKSASHSLTIQPPQPFTIRKYDANSPITFGGESSIVGKATVTCAKWTIR